MDRLLKPHRGYCRAFIDDIVIFSDTFEQHLEHLRAIFGVFEGRGVSLSPDKSFVGFQSVELLRFYVDVLGLSTTKERARGFRDLEFPRNLKALEACLGATGFLRPMIPYFAQLAEPLQLRKNALLAEGRKTGRLVVGNRGKRQHYTESTRFEPTEKESQSFADLQHFVRDNLRLYHVDHHKPLFLQVDGSLQRGLGVMAFHLQDVYEWKKGDPIPATAINPVMFLSRCLTKAELSYGPSELEVACLVWACKRLRTTIVGSHHPIVVLTDHESTKGIVNHSTLNTTSTDRANRRLINAAIYLDAYRLDVVHLPGRLNLVPDALSRLATSDEATRQQTDRLRFAEAYKEDSTLNNIIRDLQTPGSTGRKPAVTKDSEDVVTASKAGHPFRLVDRLLYNRDEQGKERLVVPRSLVQEFLHDAHDDKHHFGRDRMMADLDGLHFRFKRKLVDEYCRKCLRCGEQRKDNQMPIGDLQPIQAPEEPMRTIAMDFVVALPKVPSKGTPWAIDGFDEFDALLTVTCKTSKRTMIIPGHTTYKANHWAEVFTRQLLLSDWACPKAIISDRDAKFFQPSRQAFGEAAERSNFISYSFLST